MWMMPRVIRWLIGITVLSSAAAVSSSQATSQPSSTDEGTHVRIRVTDPIPREIALRVRSEVPADTVLRVKTGGIAMLRAIRIESVRAGNDEPLEVVGRFDPADMNIDWSWHINAMSMIMIRTRQSLAPGTMLRIAVSETGKPARKSKAASEPSRVYSGLSWSLIAGRIKQPTDQKIEPVTEPVFLDFVSGDPARIEACLKPDGRVTVCWLDAEGNPVPSADKTVKLLEEGSAAIARKPPLQARSGADRVEVRDADGRTARSNARPVALDGTPIWFGEFHWHTEFSGDGQRSLTAAMASACDELSLDFAGPADHMNGTGEYHHNLSPADQARRCQPFEEPGRFAIIAGAELSHHFGHANIYAESFDLLREMTGQFRNTLLPHWADGGYPNAALTAACPKGRAMYIPHHTNTTSGPVVGADGLPLWCAMDWPIPANNDAMRLVEICQVRGVFESEAFDPDWGVVSGGYGGSVQTALTRGYRLGFVAGTDNHSGWPTRGPNGPVAMTAVQSARLDQKSVFDALYRRRCYATTGVRIVADATLNGQPIGTEMTLAPGEPRRFKIAVKGTAPLKAVQIVHCGIVLADLPVDGVSTDFVGEWSDDRPGRPLRDTWYYVRARQTDGHRIWLSPWWIDLAK